MTQKEQGGAAFPHTPGDPGMTLRDYFAGCAIQNIADDDVTGNPGRADHLAKAAYALADAMIKERNRI